MKGHLHCIGIGGIGVSALARLYKARGWRVSGSDLTRSEITDALKKEGIRVFIGPHYRRHVEPSVAKVIYTAAVTKKLLYSFHDRRNTTTKSKRENRGNQIRNQTAENPEIREAGRRGIPIMSYAEAVGELTREFKTIAVAGAHGKSTTTALIALILTKAGFDPTVIIGTKLREFKNTNFRLGKSPYFVLEADEYRASFLNYSPAIAVITNIDREHLDFYKNIRNIEAAFLKFLLGLQPDGVAALNRDDSRLRRIGISLRKKRPDCRVLWFSLRDPKAKKIKRILRIPGTHNISNALAAYTVGRKLGIHEKNIFAALADYRGSWRRFDYQGRFAGARVYADYAHHPTEIKATLQAAREKFPSGPSADLHKFLRPSKNARQGTAKIRNQRLWCVFQPHHYERTRDLFQEFARAFDSADIALLLDIYEVAGRERKKKSNNVNSQKLAAAISRRGKPCIYLPDQNGLKSFLSRHLQKGDILIMMGAGSIWEMTKALMHKSK